MPVADLILTLVIIVALLGVMAAPVACVVYLLRLHGSDQRVPRLWLPRTLAITLILWSIPTVYLGIIAIIRTVWGLAGVPSWTSVTTTGATILMGLSGVYLLMSFLRHR